jgi:two-component system, cell cycle sensor histidine kinase and response regulator CckA
MATILLVEDDEILRLAAVRHLTQAGYTVIAASRSNEALDELDRGRPVDLAVIDVCMPKGQVNGFALARMARWRRPGLPVVFLTGYPEVLAAEAVQEPVFLKPVDLGQLTDKIKERLAA